MKRIGVLTSGGDAPGMNAAVRAVVRTARANNMSVIGFKRGYNGMLMRSLSSSDDYFEMNSRSVSGIIHHGGTMLMTARCMEFYKEEYQKMAVRNAKALDIEGIVCIGGNGTFKGAEGLNRFGLPAVGVPATIDNDLCYTEFTIGFDTALNTAVEAVNRIRDTGDAHERVFIVTVMGRDCGDIALHTALAYPETFGKAAGLSSALIVHDIAHMQPGGGNEVANYEYYRECFGDLETVEDRDTNPEVLARRLKAAGKAMPELFIACGTEDFLIENNRAFHRFLEREGIAHEYREGKGQHDMVFWHEYIAQAIEWMFE